MAATLIRNRELGSASLRNETRSNRNRAEWTCQFDGRVIGNYEIHAVVPTNRTRERFPTVTLVYARTSTRRSSSRYHATKQPVHLRVATVSIYPGC